MAHRRWLVTNDYGDESQRLRIMTATLMTINNNDAIHVKAAITNWYEYGNGYA